MLEWRRRCGPDEDLHRISVHVSERREGRRGGPDAPGLGNDRSGTLRGEGGVGGLIGRARKTWCCRGCLWRSHACTIAISRHLQRDRGYISDVMDHQLGLWARVNGALSLEPYFF